MSVLTVVRWSGENNAVTRQDEDEQQLKTLICSHVDTSTESTVISSTLNRSTCAGCTSLSQNRLDRLKEKHSRWQIPTFCLVQSDNVDAGQWPSYCTLTWQLSEVWERCKDDRQSQWKIAASFWPSGRPKPLTDPRQIWNTRFRRRHLPPNKIWAPLGLVKSGQGFLFPI